MSKCAMNIDALGGRDAPCDRENRFDVALVVGVVSGRLEDRRLLAQLRVCKQRTKSFEPDQPFADVPVPITASAERHLGVVEMEEVNAVDPDLRGRLVDEPLNSVARVDGISRGPRVRSVETDAELRVIDACNEASEFVERATRKASRTGGVF